LYHRLQLRLRGLRFTLRHQDEVDPELLKKIDLTFAVASCLPLVDALRGADFAAQNLLYALRAGEPSRLARSLAMEAGYHATAGDRAAVRIAKPLRLARELAYRTGDPAAHVSVVGAIGTASVFRGDFVDALERLRKAERRMRRLPTVAYNRAPLE